MTMISARVVPFVCAFTGLFLASACSPEATANEFSSGVDLEPTEAMSEEGTEVVVDAELAAVADAYVACVSEPLDGFIQLDLSRFSGVRETYSLPDGSDDEKAILAAVDGCDQQTGFQAAMAAAGSEAPPSDEHADIMAAAFERCAIQEGISPTVATLSNTSSVHETRESIAGVVQQVASSDPERLGRVIECEGLAVYGPKTEF